jgi:hypothetical protein
VSDALYDTDILVWSERQGELLRRIAAGERVNDSDLDWPNIAEEIESVGRSELVAVKSLLRQALVHMLKAEAWPQSLAAPGWRAEARLFQAQARDQFAPSMRQRIDVRQLYADTLKAVPDTIDGQPPLPVAQTCPVTLDELLTP